MVHDMLQIHSDRSYSMCLLQYKAASKGQKQNLSKKDSEYLTITFSKDEITDWFNYKLYKLGSWKSKGCTC